jgi:hypothetical protein
VAPRDASAVDLALYVYLLAPYGLLDYIGILHYVLADAHLLLGHRPLG